VAACFSLGAGFALDLEVVLTALGVAFLVAIGCKRSDQSKR
jgi:hypothetical protein